MLAAAEVKFLHFLKVPKPSKEPPQKKAKSEDRRFLRWYRMIPCACWLQVCNCKPDGTSSFSFSFSSWHPCLTWGILQHLRQPADNVAQIVRLWKHHLESCSTTWIEYLYANVLKFISSHLLQHTSCFSASPWAHAQLRQNWDNPPQKLTARWSRFLVCRWFDAEPWWTADFVQGCYPEKFGSSNMVKARKMTPASYKSLGSQLVLRPIPLAMEWRIADAKVVKIQKASSAIAHVYIIRKRLE